VNGAFNKAHAKKMAKWDLYDRRSWILENTVKHSRAGSTARNICARSQSVILFIGNISTDDMVEGMRSGEEVQGKL
jgi:hypothetical protein